MLNECFVAQCFDNGVYDRRYRETFAPAIQEAGATPVRADEVVGTTPIIEKIEAGLKRSAIAFAEISEDNPNVFLELGFALALEIPTVIVCDRAKRTKLPFDIQHRPVVFYSAEAQSDFDKLRDDITKNIRAALSEANELTARINITSDENSKHDMDAVKRLCLLEILDQDLRAPEGATLWQIQKGVVGAEISERMVTLAVTSLMTDGFIDQKINENHNYEEYRSLTLSDYGRKSVMRQYSSLMKEERDRLQASRMLSATAFDDEVPF